MRLNKTFLIVFLSILLLYALHFYIYNLPSADDFFYASIPDNISAFSSAMSAYYTWSSRVFSNFLYFLFAKGLDFTFYRLITFSSVILFFVIITLIINYLLMKLQLSDKILVLLLFLTTWTFGLSSPNNAIFWLGGVTNYLIPLALLTLCTFLLLIIFDLQGKVIRYILVALSLISIFISSFSNEAVLLSFLVLHIILAVIASYNKNQTRFLFYISVIIFITVLVFVINAPGNTIRMNAGGNADSGQLFWSIWKSMMTTLERGFETYFVSMLLPASIFIYLTICNKHLPLVIKKMSYKQHALIFVAIGVVTAWAAHFSIAYALGSTGLPPRAKMIPQTFYMFFFMVANIYTMKAFNFNKIVERHKGILAISFIYLILAPCFSGEYFSSLLTLGEHKQYSKMYTERFNYLKNGNGFGGDKEVIVKKFPIAPAPIASTNLTSDCSYHSNMNVAQYFKIKSCVRLEEGFDGDQSKVNQSMQDIKYLFSDGIRNYLKSGLQRKN